MVNLAETRTTTCKRCGKEFKIYRSQTTGRWNYRNFCDECNGPEKIKTVICESCGKPFQIERVAWGGFSGRKYCDNCDITKKQTKTVICKKCGKPFEVQRRQDKGGFIDRQCCDDCLADNKETKELICKSCGCTFLVSRYENTNRFQYSDYCNNCLEEKETTVCKSCGKQFKAYRSKQGRKIDIYCSNCRKQSWKTKASKTCQEKYGVTYPCQRQECINANDNIISKVNKHFYDELVKQGINVEYEKTVGEYSYDLYLKDRKILLEINPTYTHSIIGNHFNNFNKERINTNYHLSKTNNAEKENYHCIHVWQWDDWNKIVKSLIIKQIINSDDLIIKEVSKEQAELFISQYSLQNCKNCEINLGLFNKGNNLIQMVSFNNNILMNICTKFGYKVINGTQKIFNYYINKYQPKEVIVYCDVSKFSGKCYERLGFVLVEQTKPRKLWSKNNYNYGNNDVFTDVINEDAMIQQKYLPIYDCGIKIFKWKGRKEL